MSNSQKKKLAQTAAAAASKEDSEGPPMPVMPDPRIKYLWSGSPDVTQFDFTKFIQLWPAYIDSKLTLAQGRRIGKENCCGSPNIGEMSEICQSLRLRHVMEPYKQYPRLFGSYGRIRVEITKADGSYCHEEIKSKMDLLLRMGLQIPKLKSRIKRLQEDEAKMQQIQQQQEAASFNAASSAGGSAKKKKGKKK